MFLDHIFLIACTFLDHFFFAFDQFFFFLQTRYEPSYAWRSLVNVKAVEPHYSLIALLVLRLIGS